MKLIHKAILVFIVAVFLLRIPIIFVRDFDLDEFEHLHATRSLCHGMVPYRDYFEHHTPFFYFLLAPIYHFSGDRIETLFISRAIMLIFALGILYLTYVLAKLLYNPDVARYAVFFLSCMTVFMNKTIEIRPDVPAVFFELLAIIFFMQAARKEQNFRIQQLVFFLSGVTIGIAVLFTQKMLFFTIGIFLSLLWLAYDKRIELPSRRRMGPLLWAGLGILIFPAITCIYFIFNNAFNDFIYRNFIMNLLWKSKFFPSQLIAEIFKKNTFFCIASLGGFIVAATQLLDKRAVARGDFVLVLLVGVLVIGLFLVPVPHQQYYLSFIPLLSIYCGSFFAMIMNRLDLYKTDKRNSWRNSLIMLFILTGIIIFPLRSIMSVFLNPQNRFFEGEGVSVVNKHSNASQLAGIQFILHNTDSQDSVFDGWTGLGVFRNHAYYYYFLHNEIRSMLTPKELSEDILTALGAKKPKFVIFDKYVKNLPEAVTNYIKERYEPTGMGAIYIISENNQPGAYERQLRNE